MIGLVKQNLKRLDTVGYNHFVKAMEKATGVTTQKRFYMSEWGYSNTRDVILGNTDKLIKAENFDRFEMDGILAWWKNKASKRFDNVTSQGRKRTELLDYRPTHLLIDNQRINQYKMYMKGSYNYPLYNLWTM